MVERQPSKLNVASSNLVSRSNKITNVILGVKYGMKDSSFAKKIIAECRNFGISALSSRRSSVVERFLGKEEVMGSIPIVGSDEVARIAN